MRIIAVDPGSQGYVVELEFDPKDGVKVLRKFALNSYTEVDHAGLYYWLSQSRASFAAIEEPIPVVRGAGHGLLTQGANYGSLFALLACHYDVRIIRPREWQSALGLPGKDPKPMAQEVAINLVGSESLKRNNVGRIHAGIVDAVLIGYYAYLNRDI